MNPRGNTSKYTLVIGIHYNTINTLLLIIHYRNKS